MMEHHYYHQSVRPRGPLARLLIALSALSAAILFVGVCLLTINAVSESDGDTAAGSSIKFYAYSGGVAAGGYDVVSFFTEARAVKGAPENFAEWGGEKWHFASAENRAAFLKNPLHYIPQYGGHCAYGVSQGYLVRGDPQAWSIHDGKLYLNYNKNIRIAWLAAATEFITQSIPNWQKLNR